MPPVLTDRPSPTLSMQGIEVPRSSVDPREFARRTRRQILQQRSGAFAGLGGTDNLQLMQAGIITGLSIKLTGTVVVTPGTGTVASTARWPYDFLRAVKFTANGASNLINCSGAKLKARDIMALGDINDRGVARGIGGASPGTSRTQGTMSLSTEDWGLGSNVTAIPGATYDYSLNLFVPIAMDQRNLVGAIFAQTTATELALVLEWATQADLFTLTGNATVAVTCNYQIEAVTYSIPQAPNGGVIIPDLSAFHSLVQTRGPALTTGTNEVKLSGQGVGRQLCRIYWQVWNGATPVPLAVNATNFGQIGWKYGQNETPEQFDTGKHLAQWNERIFGSDLATYHGINVLDFCSEFAARDTIDEGLATELRFFFEIAGTAPALSSPFVEYVQETVFAGAAGA